MNLPHSEAPSAVARDSPIIDPIDFNLVTSLCHDWLQSSSSSSSRGKNTNTILVRVLNTQQRLQNIFRFSVPRRLLIQRRLKVVSTRKRHHLYRTTGTIYNEHHCALLLSNRVTFQRSFLVARTKMLWRKFSRFWTFMNWAARRSRAKSWTVSS
jgi:hypothetical protein